MTVIVTVSRDGIARIPRGKKRIVRIVLVSCGALLRGGADMQPPITVIIKRAHLSFMTNALDLVQRVIDIVRRGIGAAVPVEFLALDHATQHIGSRPATAPEFVRRRDYFTSCTATTRVAQFRVVTIRMDRAQRAAFPVVGLVRPDPITLGVVTGRLPVRIHLSWITLSRNAAHRIAQSYLLLIQTSAIGIGAKGNKDLAETIPSCKC